MRGGFSWGGARIAIEDCQSEVEMRGLGVPSNVGGRRARCRYVFAAGNFAWRSQVFPYAGGKLVSNGESLLIMFYAFMFDPLTFFALPRLSPRQTVCSNKIF